MKRGKERQLGGSEKGQARGPAPTKKPLLPNETGIGD